MIEACNDSGPEDDQREFRQGVPLMSMLNELEHEVRLGREALLTGNLRELGQIRDKEIALLRAVGERLAERVCNRTERPDLASSATQLKLKAKDIIAETKLQQCLLRRFQRKLQMLSRARAGLASSYGEIIRAHASQNADAVQRRP